MAKQFQLGLDVQDFKRIAWTALMAFLAVFSVLATGAGGFHNFAELKAAVLALLPTAIAAAISAVKNGVLANGSKFK